MTTKEAIIALTHACTYLKKTHGRTISEGPRRILTAALRCIGTENEVDLTAKNIKARVNI